MTEYMKFWLAQKAAAVVWSVGMLIVLALFFGAIVFYRALSETHGWSDEDKRTDKLLAKSLYTDGSDAASFFASAVTSGGAISGHPNYKDHIFRLSKRRLIKRKVFEERDGKLYRGPNWEEYTRGS